MEATRTTEPTRITATDLARNLSDILNRVRYKGERFNVTRAGEVIAVLEPRKDEVKKLTVGEFRRTFGHMRVPEGMGADIEEARKSLGGLPDIQGPSL